MNNPDVYDISYISQIRKVVLLLQIIPKNRNVKIVRAPSDTLTFSLVGGHGDRSWVRSNQYRPVDWLPPSEEKEERL